METHPQGSLGLVPDVIVEVRPPSVKWLDAFKRMVVSINSEVPVVCIFDVASSANHIFYPDCPHVIVPVK